MYHIFQKTFPNQSAMDEYIYELLEEYEQTINNDIDKLHIIRFLSVLINYIKEKCGKKEKNTLKLISLVCSSVDQEGKGVTTLDLSFASLMQNEPENFLSVQYNLVRPFIGNYAVFDILTFLKFNLLSTIVRESNGNVESAQKKYEKESNLLDKYIDAVEKLLIEQEQIINNYNQSLKREISGDLKEKLEQFLQDYKPFKIKEYLDKKIIGQEEAKKTISVAFYNHILLLVKPELKLKKNNVLMIGPSGCGKTEIMRVLSEISPIPISIFDTSGMSQNGWKGDKKIKDAVKELFIKTNDVQLSECGIIFLDEFDKMCRPAFTSSGENVSIHIQGEALAMIEGCDVSVSLNGDGIFENTQLINTTKILFICAGAFQGIEDVVKKQKNKEASIGFNGKARDTSKEITAKDITKETVMEFGVTPELAGRLSITTVLHKLTKEDMYDIITKCEDNVLDELKLLIKNGYNVDLEITDKALMKLIDKLCLDVGARGIRSVLFEEFTDILYEVSLKEGIEKIVVDDDFVTKYL